MAAEKPPPSAAELQRAAQVVLSQQAARQAPLEALLDGQLVAFECFIAARRALRAAPAGGCMAQPLSPGSKPGRGASYMSDAGASYLSHAGAIYILAAQVSCRRPRCQL